MLKQDTLVLLVGIAVCIAFSSTIVGVGLARGWEVCGNTTDWEFVTRQCPERFRSMPNLSDPIDMGTIGRNSDAMKSQWYYWKRADPSVVSRSIVWLCYALHQFSMWAIIFMAQRKEQVYNQKLRWFNWLAIVVNGLFHVIHLIQTHITYDGTAQDVNVSSSQGSVIVILVIVLIMEFRDRGFLLGWPQNGWRGNKFRVPEIVLYMVRKYHGYGFAWGTIYTFWYHPMEPTIGHAFGFAHTAFLMLQGSLMFTRAHLNKYWRLILESWVLIHSTIIAFQIAPHIFEHDNSWQRFFFGFALMFCLVQVHGLPFFKRLPWWTHIFPAAGFVVLAVAVYGAQGRWAQLAFEPIQIPLILFLAVGVGVLQIWLMNKCCGCCIDKRTSTTTKVFLIVAHIILYMLCVLLSLVLQQNQVNLQLFILMFIFLFTFQILIVFGMFIMEAVLHRVQSQADINVPLKMSK